MALIRINVTTLGYERDDEVDDLPKEWEDRLVEAGYAERVAQKNANPQAKAELTDEAKGIVTTPKK